MQRAAVLIGVKKTGDLPELQAVRPSIERMAEWARLQGFEEKLLKVVTDEKKPVTVDKITAAIKSIISRGTVEQLIVYFSGHGFNIDSEYWLLSDAPKDSNAAINVEGSLRLARYCGISHIVLISDACRSAAEGLQALQVKGSNVFPNDPSSGTENPVDILFSCARGKPSFEIVDRAKAVDEAVRAYSAVYTETLLEYLNGAHLHALDSVQENGTSIGELRLGKLADCLREDLPKRLKAKNIDPKINQLPDDRIGRKTANACMSRIVLEGKRSLRPDAAVVPVSRATPITPFTVSDRLVSLSLQSDLKEWQETLKWEVRNHETGLLQGTAASRALPFGPMQFETQCGFKVRGARVVRTVQRDVRADIMDKEGSIIRVDNANPWGSSVLLILENGSGVVVPALPDFIAALTFEGNQFLDLSYEPSQNSWRWAEYVNRAEEIRTIRGSIAASAALGLFRLSEEGGLALARRMQLSKGIDPSLALYGAYTYDSLQRRDLIEEMRAFMADDLGLIFFDVALLSRSGQTGRVVPWFPLLSQGWPLLSAYGITLLSPLDEIGRHRLPSLWTMFDGDGVRVLEEAILSGGIQ